MARYELPDGKAGKFFEITLEGARVVTVTGVAGAYASKFDGRTIYGSDAGRRGGRTYKDAASARKAYDKAVAAKKREGYQRVDRPEEVVGAPATTLRDAALERAIVDAAPGDPTPYLVYADWLQQQGDPRGELIALQHAMHRQTTSVEFLQFKQTEQALRYAHERAWLGEVAIACAHRLKLDWRLGFIESARVGAMTNPTELSTAALLAALLASPVGCAVRSLELTGPSEERSAELLAALAVLPSPGLRKLRGDARCADPVASRAIYEEHRARIAAAGVDVAVDLFG